MCGVGFCRLIHQNICLCLALYILFDSRVSRVHSHASDVRLNNHLGVLFRSLTNGSEYMDRETLSDFLKLLHLFEESPAKNDSEENKCFTASEMFDLLSPNLPRLNQSDFHALLPTIIYELKTGVCKHKHEREVVITTHDFDWKAFLAAVGAVLLVSLSGLIVVCLVPLMSRSFYNVVTQFLIALAVGSLAGDAFLHLIPHAFSGPGHIHHNIHDHETSTSTSTSTSTTGHDHDHHHFDEHHHDSMPSSSSTELTLHRRMILEALIALIGIYIFFITERLTIICQNKMSRRKLKRQRNLTLNESQLCNCSPDRPMDNSRCVDYLNEKQMNGSDGVGTNQQPYWSFNNNTVVQSSETTTTDANKTNHDHHHDLHHHLHHQPVVSGSSVSVDEGPQQQQQNSKISDVKKSTTTTVHKNSIKTKRKSAIIKNGTPVVDMLDSKHTTTSKENPILDLVNHDHHHNNNTLTKMDSSNTMIKKNISLDYIVGTEQLQTHPHRDKPHGHHHGHSHDLSSVRAIAYTIIVGDGLHNFCDGIAIGAAFASDMRGGLSTSIAVLCHELPHELGDFAVLLHAGMSVKSALFYNLFSSILCAAGMLIGFLLGGMHSLDTWIFMLAAGMFIYIALVDMMPELSANQLKGNRRCHQPSVLFLWQNFGILLGYFIMLMIAFYEFQFF